jgi:hypothetical protein
LATSGLGVLLGGNFSRQCHGLQALINATECVKSPAARHSGGVEGYAVEVHEPEKNGGKKSNKPAGDKARNNQSINTLQG